MKRFVALAGIVVALGVATPQTAGSYCDPRYDRCTNDCQESAKKLRRISPVFDQLISCPQ